MNRPQIKEEQIDATVDEIKATWISYMTEGDIIPAGGLCLSAHEMAGMSAQRDHAVQSALRVGDTARIKEALLQQAAAAAHAAASIRDDLDF